MSDVARYTAAGDGVVRTDSSGPLVRWNDYARLKAEVERLIKATEWQPIETAPRHGGSIYVRSVMFYSRDSQGWAYFQDPKTTAEWMHIPEPTAKEGKPSA
jgi:hypothetical protein